MITKRYHLSFRERERERGRAKRNNTQEKISFPLDPSLTRPRKHGRRGMATKSIDQFIVPSPVPLDISN